MSWFERIKDILRKPLVLGSIAAGAGLAGAVFWHRSRQNANDNSSANTRINAVPGTVSRPRRIPSTPLARRRENVNPQNNTNITNRATNSNSSTQPVAALPTESARENSPPTSAMQPPAASATPTAQENEEEEQAEAGTVITQNQTRPLLTPQFLTSIGMALVILVLCLAAIFSLLEGRVMTDYNLFTPLLMTGFGLSVSGQNRLLRDQQASATTPDNASVAALPSVASRDDAEDDTDSFENFDEDLD